VFVKIIVAGFIELIEGILVVQCFEKCMRKYFDYLLKDEKN
jgi:hypothetical protein